MVRISIIGREIGPVHFPENSNARAVKDDLLFAFGPGLLIRDGEGVLTETLSGDYEFHVTGATAAAAPADHWKILIRMEKKINRIDWDLSFRQMCPWLEIAETDRSRAKNLRQKIFNKLGVNNSTVTCWLTGLNCAVKVAHILPDSTKNQVLKRLELNMAFKNDTKDPRNFLVLAEAIEEAFDSMHISFCPKDLLNPTKLYLKVWNDDIRDFAIGGDNDAQNIRDLTFGGLEASDAMLKIPEGWSVSLRALSYHNLCCYIFHKSKGNESLDQDIPPDFSSQENPDKDKVHSALVHMLMTAKRFDSEAVEEALDYNEFDESKSDIAQERENRELRSPTPRRRKFCTIM